MSALTRKLHLVLTIGGGFLGAAMTLQTFFASKGLSPVVYAILMAFIALYAYCIFVGLRLVDRPQETKHLLVFYSLQVPWLSSPLIAYRFVSGFNFHVGFLDFNPTFLLRIGSDWKFSFFQSAPWGLAINLFAVLMVIVVLSSRLRRTQTPSNVEELHNASHAKPLEPDRLQS